MLKRDIQPLINTLATVGAVLSEIRKVFGHWLKHSITIRQQQCHISNDSLRCNILGIVAHQLRSRMHKFTAKSVGWEWVALA